MITVIIGSIVGFKLTNVYHLEHLLIYDKFNYNYQQLTTVESLYYMDTLGPHMHEVSQLKRCPYFSSYLVHFSIVILHSWNYRKHSITVA